MQAQRIRKTWKQEVNKTCTTRTYTLGKGGGSVVTVRIVVKEDRLTRKTFKMIDSRIGGTALGE